jgi:hypothetical protein
VRTTPLIGRKLRDKVNHAIKADRTFLEVDQTARAAYESRIAGPPAAAPQESQVESDSPAA